MTENHAAVLFDGVCNLCNASVNFIIDHDPGEYFQFASLQSEEAEELLAMCSDGPVTLETIVLIENGTCYDRSTAVLRIARRLSGVWSLAYAFMLIPRPLRDAVYDRIARSRYDWFGKRESCRVPTPDLEDRFLESTSRTNPAENN